MNNTLHIMVGLPGSGKSTKASEMLEKRNNIVLISTDDIREEFGDINDQSKNNEVYDLYYKRAETALKEGKSVILDATNTTVKSRRVAIERLRKYVKGIVAHYFNVSYEVCLYRNNTRDRNVPENVITRMYKALQIPTYAEGFTSILFYNEQGIDPCDDIFWGADEISVDEMEEYISSPQSYHEIMGGNPWWGNILQGIWELPQDNSFHSFSASRHSYYVWKYILENYDGEDRIAMLWAGLFHDAGKGFCKNFKRFEDGTISRYANFIGHENVSAQMTAYVLSQYYDTGFVLKVVEIIQYHMRLMQTSGDGSVHSVNKAYKKMNDFLGNDLMGKLEFFYEADTKAK